MLKGIDPIISPELLKILSEMGHGDEIVISDGNFPGAAMAKNLVRADGHGVVEMLKAILPLFPLDQYSDCPVVLMEVVPGDDFIPVIWDDYKKVLSEFEPNAKIETMERFAYYERSKRAYCVLQTGEKSKYANIILKKGCI